MAAAVRIVVVEVVAVAPRKVAVAVAVAVRIEVVEVVAVASRKVAVDVVVVVRIVVVEAVAATVVELTSKWKNMSKLPPSRGTSNQPTPI